MHHISFLEFSSQYLLLFSDVWVWVRQGVKTV